MEATPESMAITSLRRLDEKFPKTKDHRRCVDRLFLPLWVWGLLLMLLLRRRHFVIFIEIQFKIGSWEFPAKTDSRLQSIGPQNSVATDYATSLKQAVCTFCYTKLLLLDEQALAR